mgnify:CR=1 FL=1
MATNKGSGKAPAGKPRKASAGKPRKPAQHTQHTQHTQIGPARNSHGKKTQKSLLTQKLVRYVPSWPKWVGAAIVVLVCWLLFHKLIDKASYPIATPPSGYTVHGIDISHHQGYVNWELLRNQAAIDGIPLSFVFIKATEGTDMVDSRFSQNFAGARRYGITRGAYHFYRATLPAKQQAEHFISNVSLSPGDLPPVLDVEMKPDDISQENFRQGILEWLLRVEQHYRVKPILYTYHAFRQQYLNDSVFNLFPYWIAHYYVDSVRYQGKWHFWQYSDKGQLPGIKEKVDLDIFNGSFDDLQQLVIK